MDAKEKKEYEEYIAYLENIISEMPGNIYWKNRAGHYLGCNNNAAKAAGLKTRQDMIGKSLHDILDQQYADVLVNNDERIMSAGLEETIEEVGPDLLGNPATYITRKIPTYDQSGKVNGLIGISIDITARKKLEEEFQQLKQVAELQAKNTSIYINNIIANLPENFYWVNKDGIVLGCNHQQAKLFGLNNASEIIGRTIHEIAEIVGLDKSIADAVRANDLKVMQTGQKIQSEEISIIDGQKHTFLSFKSPLRNDTDEIIGTFGVTVEITERKKMEEELRRAKKHAEAANRSKSEFLAMVSHELRIPLTGILGMAQLIQDDERLPNDSKEQITDIINSGEHLLDLVNDLLDIAKLEANKVELDTNKINLKKLLEEVITLLTPKAKDHHLDLQAYYESDIPECFIGDSRALKQILFNIVGNAIKFTLQGYVHITVTCLKKTNTQAILQIAIEDTGIGISKDKLSAIFQSFGQADTSITRKFGGTGLGLTISKTYLNLMGGDITVSSDLGKGSKFICTFPLAIAPITINEVPATPILQNNSLTMHKTLKVLLVEDDEIVAKVHTLMLEKAGYVIERARSGEQAIKMSQAHFDVILMDIGLPDISGYEATQKIREYHKDDNLPHTPIIGLTGYAHEEYKMKCLEAGMDDVATKPIKIEALESLLHNYIKD